jgi:PelA/Pel-15E family pectate lyase
LESARILDFLMGIKNPSPEVTAAITRAHEWYEKSGVQGIRQTLMDHSTYYENDPGSRTIWWARFYDPSSNKPIFCGSQDGIIYDSFEDMWKAGNRATYIFYSPLPAMVVGEKFSKWQSALAKK